MAGFSGVMELPTKATSKRDCFTAKEPLRTHQLVTHTKESIVKTIATERVSRRGQGSLIKVNFTKESDVGRES